MYWVMDLTSWLRVSFVLLFPPYSFRVHFSFVIFFIQLQRKIWVFFHNFIITAAITFRYYLWAHALALHKSICYNFSLYKHNIYFSVSFFFFVFRNFARIPYSIGFYDYFVHVHVHIFVCVIFFRFAIVMMMTTTPTTICECNAKYKFKYITFPLYFLFLFASKLLLFNVIFYMCG